MLVVLVLGLVACVSLLLFSFFVSRSWCWTEIYLTISGKVPFVGIRVFAGTVAFVIPAMLFVVPSEVMVSVSHIEKAPSLAVSFEIGSSEETVGHGLEQ